MLLKELFIVLTANVEDYISNIEYILRKDYSIHPRVIEVWKAEKNGLLVLKDVKGYISQGYTKHAAAQEIYDTLKNLSALEYICDVAFELLTDRQLKDYPRSCFKPVSPFERHHSLWYGAEIAGEIFYSDNDKTKATILFIEKTTPDYKKYEEERKSWYDY